MFLATRTILVMAFCLHCYTFARGDIVVAGVSQFVSAEIDGGASNSNGNGDIPPIDIFASATEPDMPPFTTELIASQDVTYSGPLAVNSPARPLLKCPYHTVIVGGGFFFHNK